MDNPGSGPGPKPGGPADKYDRSKATKAALLHGEWLVMWEGSISAMKNMTDAKSVAHWCQNIEKNVVEVQRITKDFKAIGRFPPDAWPAGGVDVNGWKRLDAEYPVEVKAAEKRVEALGMPELTESLRKALAKVDEANKAFLDAFNAVAPNQPKDKGN